MSLLAAAVLASVTILLAVETRAPGEAEAQTAKPNIIFIMTDDLDERMMGRFPDVKGRIGGDGQGATLDNAFVTTSLCCPSRASFLRGQYAHNHGVLSNTGPEGGLTKFRQEGHESNNVVKQLDGSGYKTVMIGKYLNGYTGGYVPPGWDQWFGYMGAYDTGPHKFFQNGKVVSYDRLDTYVMRERAVNQIRATPNSQPLFMWVSFNAPHGPAPYPSEYEDDFADVLVPRVPSIGEDVSDKPRWVREHATNNGPDDVLYRAKLRSMKAATAAIGRIIDVLREEGKLSNTYVVFTSDNGFHYGEHRLPHGKKTPYEEDISVPLYVRGPGVVAGRHHAELALNIDLAPTFLDWAGVSRAAYMDGRSLDPVLQGQTVAWRQQFLVEHWRDGDGVAAWVPTWKGVRTIDKKLTQYPATGEEELYLLDQDRYELTDQADQQPVIVSNLRTQLGTLKDCAADRCRTAEGP